MKKLKLVLVAVVVMLLGMGNVNAQEKSVLIKVDLSVANSNIITIQPNYEVSINEYKITKTLSENDFFILVKKELDKWLSQGYVLSDTQTPSYRDYIIYVLTKKE